MVLLAFFVVQCSAIENNENDTSEIGIPVFTDKADQINPAIYGNYVLWMDWRDDNWDIYMFDIESGTESAVCTAPGHQESPVKEGSIIYWADGRSEQKYVYRSCTN